MGRRSILGHVPPFACCGIEPDAHPDTGGRIDETLVRRPEPRLQRRACRFAAAGSRSLRGPFRLARAVPHALDHGRHDEGQTDEQGIQPSRLVGADERDAQHGEQEPQTEDEQTSEVGAHGYSVVVAVAAPGVEEPSGSTMTAVPWATTADIAPDSADESNRIDTTALAPRTVAFRTRRSSAWRRVSSRRLVYSWISPPPSERRPAMML